MSFTATERSRNAPSGPAAARSPLAQLLHALNQPLTGLQCSMEVALAVPRTPEQYVRILREGLDLSERMRALVEAIREVTGGGEENQNQNQNQNKERPESVELTTVLREAVDDLKPVAEVKNIRITLDCSASSPLTVRAGGRNMISAIFRLLESALTLAPRNNGLLIETGSASAEASFRVQWRVGRASSAFTRPELGLMVAQSGLERAGAIWHRERTETFETVTVRWPRVADAQRC
jgi:signal transduction histidine kinase